MPRETVDRRPLSLTVTPDTGRGYLPSPEVFSEEAQQRKKEFLTRIGRPDLGPVLTEQTPVAIFSMESYRHDTPAQGGLGMVVGDWSYIYRKLGIPVVIVAPFYNTEVHQRLDRLWQTEEHVPVHPEDRGFTEVPEVEVRLSTGSHPEFKVPIYEKTEDNVRNIDPYHPDIKDVYNGKTNGGHRLFQEIVEGFGGHKAVDQLGLTPPLYIMNEAPVVFSAIAELDSLVKKGVGFEEAMEQVRDKTVYVNHTLVQAVEQPFQWWQFKELVYPNVASSQVENWMNSRFKNNEILLSSLALDLSAKRRGVSRLHAQEASKVFFDFSGRPVEFAAITNGISTERWAHPQLLDIYRNSGAIDAFELPGEGAVEKILQLPEEDLKAAKLAAHEDFREALKDMQDQNGNPIDLPEGVKIVGSARRAAGYKRMGLPFTDPDRLAQILEEQNAHFFISGKAHSSDEEMKGEIRRVCSIINNHPVLRERVHYIQDYSEKVSKPLIRASHVWLNYPEVRDFHTWEPKSSEADGTSKDKAILNNAIVVSTEDGGMKDAAIIEEAGGTVVPGDHAPYYLRINSDTRNGEIESFYQQLTRGLQIVDGKDSEYTWGRFVTRQLASNWDIISGGRWVKDELDFAMPKGEMRKGSTYSLPAAS
ncbi:MAG: glycogen/starch/alpha-glucan phosphorylase [Candidatus Levyibacteriota bacterium]